MLLVFMSYLLLAPTDLRILRPALSTSTHEFIWWFKTATIILRVVIVLSNIIGAALRLERLVEILWAPVWVGIAAVLNSNKASDPSDLL